ncbi:MAG TPA: zf-TFIIB domain-containing protein [Casimicrobiaceae bacterium]|nr:zf-TFIIB domain-containing protein [Casimicrobiaceae bacterium]HXU67577.1 zf-TFIIB domain-containing protein [Casimicrobiaceae bacterium]
MSELTCPGCGRAMRSLALPRAPLAPLSIDACDDCQALWLDATESQQLTPGAVIALFRAIGSSQPTRRDAYPALLPCPRCTTPLTLTQDLQHTTRFTYYRCRYGHGRFTPYVQFLREKNFIRPLDPAELGRLRAIVTTVRCVSCGGPVPLDRSAVCPYCGAPVMLLDPHSVEQALDRLNDAETKRTASEPITGDALIAIANVERALAQNRRPFESESGVDLIMAGLHALRSLVGR